MGYSVVTEVGKDRGRKKEAFLCSISPKHLSLLPFTVWHWSQKHKFVAILGSPSREEQGGRSRFCSPVEFWFSTDFCQNLVDSGFITSSKQWHEEWQGRTEVTLIPNFESPSLNTYSVNCVLAKASSSSLIAM